MTDIVLKGASGEPKEYYLTGFLLTLQEYNGICTSWNYQLLLQFFGAGVASRTFSARKREELEYLLTDKVFNKADVIQVTPSWCVG